MNSIKPSETHPMKRKSTRLLFYPLVALSMIGCTNVQPNFLINGQNSPSVDDPAIDSVPIVSVLVGQPLSFVESSEPAGTVQEVLWDFNGDGEWDAGPNDAYEVAYTFDEPGLKHITMMVDGNPESAITKRVMINEEVKIQVAPDLNFLSPPTSFEETESQTYAILVQTTNIFSASELTLAVNNVPHAFEYNDMSGEVSALVELLEGENRIEVLAKIDGQDDEFSKLAYIVRGKGTETKPRPKPKPKTDPKPTPAPPGPTPVAPTDEKAVCDISYAIGASGFPSRKVAGDCAIAIGNTYTLGITPKTCMELVSLKLYTDDCGEATVSITWEGGSEKLVVGLTGGLSTCNIYDLGVQLKKGVKYELKITTRTASSCSAQQAPALLDLSKCDGKALASKEMELNYYGKQVIADLEYYY